MEKLPVERPEQADPQPDYLAGAVSSSGAAAQHTVRNIRLIIGREYTSRVKARAFLITSILLLVIVFLAPFIPTIVQYITSGTSAQTHIVVVNEAGSVAGLDEAGVTSLINTALNGTKTGSRAPYAISSQPQTSLSSLQSQVKQGNLDILLVLERLPNQALRFTYDTDASSPNDTNLPTIQALVQQLNVLDVAHRLGLTSSQLSSLFAPPDVAVVYTQGTGPTSASTAEILLALAGAILLFVSVATYGGIVAAGVAEEKSSRVMEILVNAATPFQLLAGKILGIGAACLTQMGSVVVVGIGALLLQLPLQTALFGASTGGFVQHFTSVSIPFYLLFLVYLLLAFFLYATVYAGLGALVKRQEEVQSATMLPTLLILSGYLLFFLTVSAPDATWTKVLSYIPFWTPVLMLMRLAVGTVAWWEIVMTIALMLLTILAGIWFAARLYRLGVLLYGQRPGLGQLMNLVRMTSLVVRARTVLTACVAMASRQWGRLRGSEGGRDEEGVRRCVSGAWPADGAPSAPPRPRSMSRSSGLCAHNPERVGGCALTRRSFAPRSTAAVGC
jgi:ABC-2 type transport system permease protein